MRKILSKFSEIAPAQPHPPKSTIFPDHPHPTSWLKVVRNRGMGLGGVQGWKVKRDKKEYIKRDKYKTKQREFNQVGHGGVSLSIGFWLLISWCFSKVVLSRAYQIKFSSIRMMDAAVLTASGLVGIALMGSPALLCVALTRDFSQGQTNTQKTNSDTKEVTI